MKKFVLLLFGLLLGAAVPAQDLNISRISGAVPVEGLGLNAVLIVSAPVEDLTVDCLSGHSIEPLSLGPDGSGMYRYKVLIDLSDPEQLRVRRRLSFSQRGKINAVTDTRRYRPGTQVEMDILVVRQPLRVESATTAASMIPEAEKSCIEIHYENDDLDVRMLAGEWISSDTDAAALPKKDEEGNPIRYRRYELRREQLPNETYRYTLTFDLSPYVRELKPAYEKAREEQDAGAVARVGREAAVLLNPGFSIGTNETNRQAVQVDSLMPRGKRVYHIIALQSEYLNYLSNAERCYADGDYFRAYKYFNLAVTASDRPADPENERLLKTNMNRSARCHNSLRKARVYFDAGERVRLGERVLTSEVDSARVYYAACEMKCREVLQTNPRDEYSLSTIDRIRQIRARHLKRIVYGTVVDNMRQSMGIGGVSIYGVPSFQAAQPEKAIDPVNLLGRSGADGAFRLEVEDGIAGLVFVHETDKNYRTPTVERIPADLHRKLLIKMRPKNIYQ